MITPFDFTFQRCSHVLTYRFHVSVESSRGAMQSSGDFESDSDPMAIAVDEVRSS